jgi:hypothetical protein
MNRTADVPVPFVATAIPRPFAIDCGELHVCGAATSDPGPAQINTNMAIDFPNFRYRSLVALLLNESPIDAAIEGALFFLWGPSISLPARIGGKTPIPASRSGLKKSFEIHLNDERTGEGFAYLLCSH